MAALTSTPLSDFSKNWTFLPQDMQPLEAKGPSGSRDDAREQVEVPGGTFDFQVKGGNSTALNKSFWAIFGLFVGSLQSLDIICGHIFQTNCDLFKPIIVFFKPINVIESPQHRETPSREIPCLERWMCSFPGRTARDEDIKKSWKLPPSSWTSTQWPMRNTRTFWKCLVGLQGGNWMTLNFNLNLTLQLV